MPTRRIVPASEVPAMPLPGGRNVSPKQQVVDEELEDARDDLLDLYDQGNPELSLLFEFSSDEDPQLKFTSPTASTAKDACRRMFRNALGKLKLEKERGREEDDFLFSMRYEFDLERLPSGEMMVRGFRVYAEPNFDDEGKG